MSEARNPWKARGKAGPPARTSFAVVLSFFSFSLEIYSFSFLHGSALVACMYVNYVCAVPTEFRARH